MNPLDVRPIPLADRSPTHPRALPVIEGGFVDEAVVSRLIGLQEQSAEWSGSRRGVSVTVHGRTRAGAARTVLFAR